MRVVSIFGQLVLNVDWNGGFKQEGVLNPEENAAFLVRTGKRDENNMRGMNLYGFTPMSFLAQWPEVGAPPVVDMSLNTAW